MYQYRTLVNRILKDGKHRGDRTGTGTLSVFGHQSEYDLTQGFPLLTLKKTYWKGVIAELIWFLNGDTNVKYLQDNGVRIWNEWADKDGNLGPIYGAQWRNWNGIDQIKQIIDQLTTNPTSRRLLVSAWNVTDLPQMALMPCHSFFQFYVDTETNQLSCQLYQRSADVFLGVPFNIASYAALVHIMAQRTGLKIGRFIHVIGDAHLYTNHIDQAKLMMKRDDRRLPQLAITGQIPDDLKGLSIDQFHLLGYNPHPAIKAEVSV